jgi:hypothetical protein
MFDPRKQAIFKLLNPVKDSARCLKGNLIKSSPLILFLKEASYHNNIREMSDEDPVRDQ